MTDSGFVFLGDGGSATDVSAAITAHDAATDPHADRAYADTGLAGKVGTARQVIAGTGLTGGGTLAADRTLTVAYGTSAGTATEGNDTRVTGAAQKASNLSDLASASTARTSLGLGGAATLAVGTTTGTVAAGDDSRITGAIANSLVDAKGDLIVATAADTVARMAVGATNGHVLKVASGQSTGLQYAAATDTSTIPTGDSATAPTPGSSLLGAPADHAHPRWQWTPADHNLKTWTMDPLIPTGGSIITAGTLNFVRVHLPVAASITNIILHVTVQGAVLTSNQCLAGLYTAAGAKIDLTGDQSGTWNSTGNKTMALSGGAYSAAAGDYYIVWWSNGSTQPTFLRNGSTAAVNLGLSAPNFRSGIANTGLTDAASAPLNMGTQTADVKGWFAALS